MRHVSLALACALFVAGCASTHALAPATQPRDADALAVKQSFDATSEATFPRQDWWKSLGDPQLDAQIDEALAGTPSLAAADARVRQAIAQAGLADAARKPTLGGTAQYAGVLLPENLGDIGGDYQGFTLVGLNFKWSLDLWGGHAAQWRDRRSSADARLASAAAVSAASCACASAM